MSLLKLNAETNNRPSSLFDDFFLRDFFYDSNDKKYHARNEPLLNISETENSIDLDFLIPGFSKDQLSINANNEVLTVEGSIENETIEENKKFSRKQFVTNSFKKSIKLPKTIDVDKVSAEYESGILKVRLPKIEEKDNLVKSIEIK